MIFDKKLESQIVALFDASSLHQFSKFNNFLCVCWFSGKNLSNCVPLPPLKTWRPVLPYCILLSCNVGKDKCPPNFVSKNNLSYCLKLCLHSLLQSIIYQTNNQKVVHLSTFFSSYMITSFSSWTFFVLLNAYYGGALTMFFTSEVKIWSFQFHHKQDWRGF